MSRNWHYLKSNEGESVPRRLVVFDCETLPRGTADNDPRRELHTLRIGCAVKGRYRAGKLSAETWLDFTAAADFWRFTLDGARERETTWLFAHNALFDLRMVGLVDMLDGGGWQVSKPRIPKDPSSKSAANSGGRALAVIDSPPTILCIQHVASGAKVLCVDTLNWLCLPLASIGTMLGIDKLPMPEFAAPDSDWLTYCKRDVDVTLAAVLRWLSFCTFHKLGNFGKTIAQQAMNAFRHGRMRHKICLHDETSVRALERGGYFGGQSEVFRYGAYREPVAQLDVNSLYPAMMRENLYPCRLARWEIRQQLLALAPQIEPAASIAVVELSTSGHCYPLRTPRGVIYARGEFQTTLAGPELAHAIARGHVKRWGSWAEYDLAPLFASYVDEFWQLRQRYAAEGDEFSAALCKLLLNSLYGKFGQRRAKWEDRPEISTPFGAWQLWYDRDSAGVVRKYRAVGWHVQEESDRGEVQGAFPAIAAFVTSYGRMAMARLRELAGHREVFYQGVDSLVVSAAGLASLRKARAIDSARLGKLRLEREATSCALWGPGDYEIGERIVISGRARGWQRTASGGYQELRFVTSADLFREPIRNGIEIQTIETHRRANFWKRIIRDDGFCDPHRIVGCLPAELAEHPSY